MRLLIATHGTMAEGLKSALSVIVGKVDKVDTICGYVDEENIHEKIKNYFENCQEEVIVCTDLFGGSVNQAFIQQLKNRKFILVTGIQLPVLLEIVLAIDAGELDMEHVVKIVENSIKQTLVVNELLNVQIEDDFN